ncbi:MAG: hypothetical protein HY961_09035 [Ignavibacteriae bacterium]|nr:hypothetical protein [Ignavibacteriota bacterium]
MDERITHFISEAEKNIESRQYGAALEALAAAETIDPENKSVEMIKNLVKSLQVDVGSLTKHPTTAATVSANVIPGSFFDKLRNGKFLK